MRFEVIFAPEALEDMKRLDARIRSTLRDGIKIHLLHQPQMESRSRIKRLRGLSKPQYRLRVEEFRIFYDVDVDARTVSILGILPKSLASEWLAKWEVQQ